RAADGDLCAIANQLGRIATSDHSRYSQLARDDRRVARAPAAIRDDGSRAFHDGLPIRIRHVRDQHIAGLHARHLLHVADDPRATCTDALADRPPLREYFRATLERETL